jgi:hypothetical protein
MHSNTIDLKNITYKVQPVKYLVNGDHADFVFKVVGPSNMSFHIKDRYSSLRQFQSLIKKDLDESVNLASLPQFPKKKYLKTMDPKFLDLRMIELGRYFNAFLENPKIAGNKYVMLYLAERAADQESQNKIAELNQMLINAKERENQ